VKIILFKTKMMGFKIYVGVGDTNGGYRGDFSKFLCFGSESPIIAKWAGREALY
jgi:hypothetical protein